VSDQHQQNLRSLAVKANGFPVFEKQTCLGVQPELAEPKDVPDIPIAYPGFEEYLPIFDLPLVVRNSQSDQTLQEDNLIAVFSRACGLTWSEVLASR